MIAFKRRFVELACICLAATLFVSCESGGGGSDDEYTPSSESAVENISGTWQGISSTGQVGTTLHLSESGGNVSGRLNWPNDTRTISGSHSGATVVFNVEGGDRWTMTFSSGNTLRGAAVKPDGNTYRLSFSRKSF